MLKVLLLLLTGVQASAQDAPTKEEYLSARLEHIDASIAMDRDIAAGIMGGTAVGAVYWVNRLYPADKAWLKNAYESGQMSGHAYQARRHAGKIVAGIAAFSAYDFGKNLWTKVQSGDVMEKYEAQKAAQDSSSPVQSIQN